MSEYKLYATAKKTAQENGLVLTTNRWRSNENYYYDLSILNDMDFSDEEKEIIVNDLMKHQVMFFDQPLPTVISLDNFNGFVGQINTHAYRVFNSKTWKRTMVIIKVVKVHLEKQHRQDVWSSYDTVKTYDSEIKSYDKSEELEV